MSDSPIRRGVLGNVLFSFASVGSGLFLILIGNLLNYYGSWALIFLFCLTLARTGFLCLALYCPYKKRLPRFISLFLTMCGLIAFNFAIPVIYASLQYLVLEVFIHEWARSDDEENYLSKFFLEGYYSQPPGEPSSWVLSPKCTLLYIFIHEMLTFGLWFPFRSRVSSFSTPFHAAEDEYEAVMSSPRQAPLAFNPHAGLSHSSLSTRRSVYPLELGRELESDEIPRDAASAPPSPPQNPMYVPTSIAQAQLFTQAQHQQEWESDPRHRHRGDSNNDSNSNNNHLVVAAYNVSKV